MTRVPTAVATALTAALLIAMPATAAQPANPFVARLLAMNDLQRRAVLRGALGDSGERCRRVEVAQARGPYHNLFMWSVRCSPSGDFGMFVGPDGSVQVRTCGDLAKLGLPACGLPAALPPAGTKTAAKR